MIGKVIELFITQEDESKKRVSVNTLQVDAKGIIGDKFYDKNLQRSILVTSTDSYALTKDNNIDIAIGSLGENILIDINPYHLLPGDKIKIASLELEVTQNGTLCKGLSSVNAKLPKLLKNDRGVFTKLISEEGVIQIGDKVEIFKN